MASSSEYSLIWYKTPLNYWKPYIHRTWICRNAKFFEPVDHVRGSTGGWKLKILRYSSNAEVIEDSWPVHVGDVDQYSRWCCCLGVLNRVIDTGGGSEAICCCNEPLLRIIARFFSIHYRSTTTTDKTAGDVGHDHEETNSGGTSEDVMDWFFSEFNGVWKSTFCWILRSVQFQWIQLFDEFGVLMK